MTYNKSFSYDGDDTEGLDFKEKEQIGLIYLNGTKFDDHRTFSEMFIDFLSIRYSEINLEKFQKDYFKNNEVSLDDLNAIMLGSAVPDSKLTKYFAEIFENGLSDVSYSSVVLSALNQREGRDNFYGKVKIIKIDRNLLLQAQTINEPAENIINDRPFPISGDVSYAPQNHPFMVKFNAIIGSLASKMNEVAKARNHNEFSSDDIMKTFSKLLSRRGLNEVRLTCLKGYEPIPPEISIEHFVNDLTSLCASNLEAEEKGVFMKQATDFYGGIKSINLVAAKQNGEKLSVGNVIKALRCNQNLSLNNISEQTGISKSNLIRYESGTFSITPSKKHTQTNIQQLKDLSSLQSALKLPDGYIELTREIRRETAYFKIDLSPKNEFFRYLKNLSREYNVDPISIAKKTNFDETFHSYHFGQPKIYCNERFLESFCNAAEHIILDERDVLFKKASIMRAKIDFKNAPVVETLNKLKELTGFSILQAEKFTNFAWVTINDVLDGNKFPKRELVKKLSDLCSLGSKQKNDFLDCYDREVKDKLNKLEVEKEGEIYKINFSDATLLETLSKMKEIYGLSINKISQLTNTRRGNVEDVFKGKRFPKEAFIDKFCDICNLSEAHRESLFGRYEKELLDNEKSQIKTIKKDVAKIKFEATPLIESLNKIIKINKFSFSYLERETGVDRVLIAQILNLNGGGYEHRLDRGFVEKLVQISNLSAVQSKKLLGRYDYEHQIRQAQKEAEKVKQLEKFSFEDVTLVDALLKLRDETGLNNKQVAALQSTYQSSTIPDIFAKKTFPNRGFIQEFSIIVGLCDKQKTKLFDLYEKESHSRKTKPTPVMVKITKESAITSSFAQVE